MRVLHEDGTNLALAGTPRASGYHSCCADPTELINNVVGSAYVSTQAPSGPIWVEVELPDAVPFSEIAALVSENHNVNSHFHDSSVFELYDVNDELVLSITPRYVDASKLITQWVRPSSGEWLVFFPAFCKNIFLQTGLNTSACTPAKETPLPYPK